MIDILDQLQDINDTVRLVLKSGEVDYGVPDCITYDDETEEVFKELRFVSFNSLTAKYYRIEDIVSFEIYM